MAVTTDRSTAAPVRKFQVKIPKNAVDDLRRRIKATRFPEGEPLPDASQGVHLATMQALMGYWGRDYDFCRVERRLNELPQFVTEIDGLDIRFIRVEPGPKDALPLIITHGWPGSVVEMLNVIGPLSDPTAQGGKAAGFRSLR